MFFLTTKTCFKTTHFVFTVLLLVQAVVVVLGSPQDQLVLGRILGLATLRVLHQWRLSLKYGDDVHEVSGSQPFSLRVRVSEPLQPKIK